PAGQDVDGSGEFWFNRGSALKLLAQERTTQDQLRGWLIALGIPGVQNSSTDISSLISTTIAANVYRGFAIAALKAPITISWDYGDPIFHEDVTLGNAVQFQFPSDPGFDMSKIQNSSGQTKKADDVRIAEGPPGSTVDDMQIWDDVAKKIYP